MKAKRILMILTLTTAGIGGIAIPVMASSSDTEIPGVPPEKISSVTSSDHSTQPPSQSSGDAASHSIPELSDSQKSDDFVRQFVDMRRKRILRKMEQKLNGNPEGEGGSLSNIPAPGYPSSPSAPRKKKEVPVYHEPKAIVLGHAGPMAIVRIGGKVREMRVGQEIDGYRLVTDNGSFLLQGGRNKGSAKNSGHSRRGLHSSSSSSRTGIPVTLLNTSHFYARVSFRGDEQEVGIGTVIMDRYKVTDIGRNTLGLEDIRSGQRVTLEQEETSESIPTYPGMVPPPRFPPPPFPAPGQAQKSSDQDNEDY